MSSAWPLPIKQKWYSLPGVAVVASSLFFLVLCSLIPPTLPPQSILKSEKCKSEYKSPQNLLAHKWLLKQMNKCQLLCLSLLGPMWHVSTCSGTPFYTQIRSCTEAWVPLSPSPATSCFSSSKASLVWPWSLLTTVSAHSTNLEPSGHGISLSCLVLLLPQPLWGPAVFLRVRKHFLHSSKCYRSHERGLCPCPNNIWCLEDFQ